MNPILELDASIMNITEYGVGRYYLLAIPRTLTNQLLSMPKRGQEKGKDKEWLVYICDKSTCDRFSCGGGITMAGMYNFSFLEDDVSVDII